MKYTHYTPKRVKQPDRPRWRLPVLLAAVLVSLGLLMAPNGEAHVAEALPPATPSPTPVEPSPTPTPAPTPTPVPAYNFTRPAPCGTPRCSASR